MQETVAAEPIVWPQILSAAATLVACLVALFGDRIRSILFRPKLDVALENLSGFLVGWDHVIPANGIMPAVTVRRETRWYHLTVRNAAFMQWPLANDVRAYITKLEEYRNGRYVSLWELQVPLNFRHESAFSLRRTLGPPIEVDLLSVSDGTLSMPSELRLQTHSSLTSIQTVFSGAIQLRATVKSDSIEGSSEDVSVIINWDGAWHSGATEMRNHLQLEVVQRTN